MNPRRYADDTQVPISRSRYELDELLRRWGAEGVQWTDDWANGKITLRFVWPRENQRYAARFDVRLPNPAEIRERLQTYGGTNTQREQRIRRELEGRGRAEMRLLVLWIKAALNAVAGGIVDAETVFLPFLEGRDGQTVAEVARPRLPALLGGSADRLLGDGR